MTDSGYLQDIAFSGSWNIFEPLRFLRLLSIGFVSHTRRDAKRYTEKNGENGGPPEMFRTLALHKHTPPEHALQRIRALKGRLKEKS